jgi:GTP-binding protein
MCCTHRAAVPASTPDLTYRHTTPLLPTRYRGPLDTVRKGAMVSTGDGKATTYALFGLQDRGVFLVPVGADVYNGMVVGEHTRDSDLEVNPCREKKLTNVRSVEADEKMFLPPPRVGAQQLPV